MKFYSLIKLAFREGKSTFNILILHGLFLEYRFNKMGPRGGNPKKHLYRCFLDLEEAFDNVPRHKLFSKVYNSGIRGKMFRVIKDLFSSNPANVLLVKLSFSQIYDKPLSITRMQA